jgi:hypothetical protein
MIKIKVRQEAFSVGCNTFLNVLPRRKAKHVLPFHHIQTPLTVLFDEVSEWNER